MGAAVRYRGLPRGDPSPETSERVRRAIDAMRAALIDMSEITVIESRTDDPVSPVTGRIWLRTDL